MSREALNPEQFGFLPTHPWEEQEKIGAGLTAFQALKTPSGEMRIGWPKKMIDLNRTPLRANHDLYPEAVQYYVQHPKGSFTGQPDRDPTVVKYKGEHVILSGHHRIAAARQRGQKRMKVDYGEIES